MPKRYPVFRLFDLESENREAQLLDSFNNPDGFFFLFVGPVNGWKMLRSRKRCTPRLYAAR